ncbi:MAG: DUF928 domain-containing protein [Nitrospirae bacterium]|nr:MAG: DUF928 domain-containing protein [Nitrospirota bacterium]
MKKFALSVTLALLLAIPLNSSGAGKEPAVKKDGKKQDSGFFVNYKPKAGSIGRPVLRIGGGTRGAGYNTPVLAALAPDHVGLTTREKPTLCWYLSDRARTRLEITINDEASPRPVFEREFTEATEPGIQCMSLAGYDVSLTPDVEYQWFVAIVVDPEHRSRDIVSTGMIKRVMPSPQLISQLGSAGSELGKAAVYASEGIWYDALSLLSARIIEQKEDRGLRAERARLLDQAGLTAAAAFDRQ